ncbi:MAG TPA: hypothetical protein VKU19_19705 [Bryobacteraceae bacterium]|nr:hypothetical protein [Bryobacteraceae bacterium]
MFTWICPQCGREVPPAYNECPDCKPAGKPADADKPAGESTIATVRPFAPGDYTPPGYPQQPPQQPGQVTQQFYPPQNPANPQAPYAPPQGYGSQQPAYPQAPYGSPQQPYPPAQQPYPPPQQYPPQPGYPPQGYPPQQAYGPPQPPYPAPPQGYPPQQPQYPPPQPAPPQQAPPVEQSTRPGPAPSFLGLSGGPPIGASPAPSAPPYTPPADTPPTPRPASSSSFLGSINDVPSSFSAAPAAPARRGLPTWLLFIICLVVLGGVVGGAYWLLGSSHGGATAAPSATVESPAAKPGAKTSPYQKFIEITGVRFVEDAKKKPAVMFIIVNHSNAPIEVLAGNVTVWGRTRSSEEEATGTFTFKTSLKPNESKELTSPLITKLKFYELPDWQNVSTDIQITEPAASGG